VRESSKRSRNFLLPSLKAGVAHYPTGLPPQSMKRERTDFVKRISAAIKKNGESAVRDAKSEKCLAHLFKGEERGKDRAGRSATKKVHKTNNQVTKNKKRWVNNYEIKRNGVKQSRRRIVGGAEEYEMTGGPAKN